MRYNELEKQVTELKENESYMKFIIKGLRNELKDTNHAENEAKVWAQFAMACASTNAATVTASAEYADHLLDKYKQRFKPD